MFDAIFTAIYDDGFCYLDGKQFPAGSFVVALLNDHEGEDYLGRAGALFPERPALHAKIERSSVKEAELKAVGEKIIKFLELVSNVCPFSLVDTDREAERIYELFLSETAISMGYSIRTSFEDMDEDADAQIIEYPTRAQLQDALVRHREIKTEIKRTINRYCYFHLTIHAFLTVYHNFLYAIQVASNFNVTDPVTIANYTFVDHCDTLHREYTLFSHTPSAPKKIVEQIYFPTYSGLLMTDFFEALLHGHYAQQCEICGKYFLATIRNPQRYCDGLSTEVVNGHQLSCRQVAAQQSKKERSKKDPRKDIYRRRNACIRSEASRGTISKPFAEKAKVLTKEYLERSIVDMNYALHHYQEEMKRENLYQEVRTRWNIEC